MKKWFVSAVLLGGICIAPCLASAQQPSLITPPATSKHKNRKAPDNPVVEPNLSIPVTPLGFAPPAPFYLGSRTAQVSIDFLDENTLLFTFRVPGLISREHASSSESADSYDSGIQRHIRAVVLSLPEGNVTAEALWTVHDNVRYLWALKDHHFLLRDRNTVQLGDSTLRIEPFLRFPGPVTYLELDPEQRQLIANTSEAASTDSKAEKETFPSTSSARVRTGEENVPSSSQSLLRILDMDSRTVILFSHVEGVVHLPLDGDAYYEALRGSGRSWMITRQDLHGASIPLTSIESSCSPTLDAIAPNVVLVTACLDSGGRRITAINKDNRLPWDITLPPTWIWPQLGSSSNPRRFARAVLDVTHAVGPTNPLDGDDIRGQLVQVYDLANGKLELTIPASPALDGGGNFAISPSGNRLAVLNAGAIQIYNLPPPPPLP